jgi:hypothetical protein
MEAQAITESMAIQPQQHTELTQRPLSLDYRFGDTNNPSLCSLCLTSLRKGGRQLLPSFRHRTLLWTCPQGTLPEMGDCHPSPGLHHSKHLHLLGLHQMALPPHPLILRLPHSLANPGHRGRRRCFGQAREAPSIHRQPGRSYILGDGHQQ